MVNGFTSPLTFAGMFCSIGGFHVAAAELGMVSLAREGRK